MNSIAKSKSYIGMATYIAAAKYVGLAVIFWILCIAKIGDGLQPFKLGLYLALAFSLKNYLKITGAYFVASALSKISIANIVVSGICCGVVVLLCVLHKKTNIKISMPFVVFYVALCCLGEMYLIVNSQGYIYAFLHFLLNAVFTIACTVFYRAFARRNYNLSLNVDEGVCGALIVMGIFCGLANINLYYVDFVRLFAALILLFATYVCPNHWTTTIGIVVGFGVALATENVAYVALFCCMGLVCSVFKSNIKILSIVAMLFVDILFGLYFEVFYDYSLFNIVALAIGSGGFLLVSSKVLQSINNRLFSTNNNYAYKNFINQNKQQTSRQLLQVSDVFFEMDKVFRKLVKGNLNIEDAKRMIISELINASCDNCPNKTKCMRSYGTKMQEVFEELVDIGFEKGRITLLDIPSYLTSRCGKVNSLVTATNELLADYKKYSTTVANLDNSRVLIAEQLSGVSRILKNLAQQVKTTIVFDNKKENRITEELAYKNVTVNEVAVYEKSKDVSQVSLVVSNNDIDNAAIIKTVQKVCSSKMQLSDITPAETSGLTVMTLTSAPKYDIMFGLAHQTKDDSEISGDTYSILKLDDDKYLMAICDGMGSGEKANRASTLSISLVENFYKAGFDNDIILSSVNKLLNIGSSDVFSALDICVVDLKNSIADFIKLGGCVGFIKHKDTTSVVESGALPMGILQDVSPKISKTALDTTDMVVLVSDGITESFEDESQLKDFINNIQNTNPQGFADELLEHVINLNYGVKKDDMTVLVARVFCRE